MMRAISILLVLSGSACSGSNVELELVPNKYLLLPFATAELDAGKLSLGANGLWPLAAGRRYLCWATDTRGVQPVRRLGEIKNGWLVVRETSLGIKLADYDRLSCTIEAEAEPAAPGAVVALAGAPGKVLMFASEGLLAELKPSRARFRIEGQLADYSWEGLPPLPAGFRYGLYLKGVLPDPNVSSGVGTSHQHLAGEREKADTTAAPTGERLLRVARLDGQGGRGLFAEKTGRNLTGHRKAICAIEADDGDGLPTITALVAPDGTGEMSSAAPNPPPPDPGPGADAGPGDGQKPAGKLEATLAINPSHPHAGEVITFSFRVTEDGAPATGLAPTASYQHLSGATGTISLAADSTPGTYLGTKPFFATGQYLIKLAFSRGGQEFSKSFDLVIEEHP